MNPQERHLVLYDGLCGFCDRTVAFVLANDREENFHFAPLQSAVAQSILRQWPRDATTADTFYVVADYLSGSRRLLSKARAALFIASRIQGVWRWAAPLGILPDFVLNGAYDVVARHRYRMFGKYNSCQVPDPRHKARFIS